MSATRRRGAGTTRKLVALTFGALLAVFLPVMAEAAPPAPSIDFAISDSTTVPQTPGSDGLVYVVKDQAFDVTLTFLDKKGVPTPLSTSDATPVDLSYRVDGGAPTSMRSASLPAGETSLALLDVSIGVAAAKVDLVATATTKHETITSDSKEFDVLISSVPVNGRTAVGGENGAANDCNPTDTRPVCGDLVPPDNGFADPGFLSQGCLANDGCESTKTFVQALASFNEPPASQTLPLPATLVMKCDKTLCGGGAIRKQTLKVTLSPDPSALFGGELTAPACLSKGVVTYDPTQDYSARNAPFCVDYVQSTRDIAGDTLLYLLFVVDARIRFP